MFLPSKESIYYQRTNSDSSKMKKIADDNFKFNEIGRKFFLRIENPGEKEKLLIMGNFAFSHRVSCTADT